jgi:hypothetical protein
MTEPSIGRHGAHSRVSEIAGHARAVADDLVGLPIEEARARVAREGHLVFREITRRGQPVTADFRANRITVLVEAGAVVQARGGA